MNEIELKLLLDEPPGAVWKRLRALKLIAGPPKSRLLRGIYFDTPDQALRREKVALRLRREGRRWVQTLKVGRRMSGGLSQAAEYEADAPGGRLSLDRVPEGEVRDMLAHLIGDRPLQPVCETVIKRSTAEISIDGTIVEFAIDIGEILAGGKSAPLQEAELELLGGEPGGLFTIAAAVFPAGGLRLSRLSKSARGYLLADKGYVEPPPAARGARDIALERGFTAADAFHEIIHECADQIATNAEMVRSADGMDPTHQLRIGLRRLRSALWLLSRFTANDEVRRLDGEAAWLAAEAGRLRDLETMYAAAAKLADAHGDEPGLRLVARRLAALASEERASLRNATRTARVHSLILDAMRFAESRGWETGDADPMRRESPALDVAGEALSRCWRNVRRKARKIETLNVEERHALRKQLKKLRYAIEFFATLYDDRKVDRTVRRLRRLQDVFGEVNDAAAMGERLNQADIVDDGDPVLQRGIGWALGAANAHADIAWGHARAEWRELKDGKRFWE